ncbi:MAG: hypothetical protein ACLGIY_21220, partial [Betaproteobacteria bacterium]
HSDSILIQKRLQGASARITAPCASAVSGGLRRCKTSQNSYGYCCVLRLAAHHDPQRTLAARFVQRIPSAYLLIASCYQNDIKLA